MSTRPISFRFAAYVVLVFIGWLPGGALAESGTAPAAEATTAPYTPNGPKESALRVAISPFRPLVFLDTPTPTGYSIDLWNKIAEELNVTYTFVPMQGVGEKLKAIVENKVDVAIGGITVTSKREREMDFTHATLQAGLSILVRDEESIGFRERLSRLFTKTRLSILVGFLLLIVVAGHLMWWAERGRASFSDKYTEGVAEGMYWALVTASTVGYGDKVPNKWLGRLLAMVVIVFSLPLFALFTAELTSAMTLQEIQSSSISGPRDLVHRRVGVIRATEGASWSSSRDLDTRPYNTLDDAYQALLAQEVDALVYDSPSLMYLSQHEGQGKVHVVGNTFVHQGLGIVVPTGSELRERINRAILDLEESGEIARIHARWFG